jgi:hypothetical protein
MTDPIAPARGCAVGFLAGALAWVLVLVVLALIVSGFPS